MKTIEQLKQFYETELLTSLETLENKRKKILRKCMITFAVAAVIGLAVVVGIFANGSFNPVIFILLAAVLPIVCAVLVYSIQAKGYVSSFKQLIIARLVKFVDEGLAYNAKGFIDKPTFMLSQIFKTKPNKYKGDDLVEGTVGKTKIRFSELNAKYESGSGKNKTVKTIFKGLFFIADFNKHFSCQTVVLPDNAEKLFGRLGQKFQAMNFTRGKLIRMEDPEFEKHFVVYGSDQIGARYILSTSLMQRIVDFKNRTQNNIHLSFVGSMVFVGISYRKNLFEPRIFTTLLDFEPIQEYFEDLQTAIGIVEDLNLNRRIWTKQ